LGPRLQTIVFQRLSLKQPYTPCHTNKDSAYWHFYKYRPGFKGF
jgi:hypothetical protein